MAAKTKPVEVVKPMPLEHRVIQCIADFPLLQPLKTPSIT